MGKSMGTLRQILFLVSAPLFFINFAIPVQAKQLGASAVEIGALFSLFTVSLLILRPLVGIALDRYGRKPFVVLALAVYGIANLLFAFATDVNAMYVARILQGVGASLLLISVDTITADLMPKDLRMVAMGRNMETQTRSSILGAIIGFSLLGAMPLVAWKYSFGIFAILAIAGLFVAYFRLPETMSQVHKAGDAAPVITPGLRRLLLVVFLAGFSSALIAPIYLIYLQDKFQLPLHMLAWAFLPGGIIFAVLPSRLGRLGARFGNVRMLSAGLMLPGLLYLLLPHLELFVGVVVVYTFATLGWALFEPARKTLTAAYGGLATRGRVFGIAELYSGIGASLGPLVGGYLYDNAGEAAAFYLNGGLLIVTSLVALILLSSSGKVRIRQNH